MADAACGLRVADVVAAWFAMHDFKRLRVWQDARAFATDVHALTQRFPKSDRQVIASQLRRSALSISATIAEGCGKASRGETLRYLQMAAGSASESENHLIIAGDLRFIPPRACEEFTARAIALQRMLDSLCRKFPAT
jgi:four helix bundle protein